ncbi:MAG: nuclear transport factor 2 family protein [Prevotellaceae bacterium]|jgi:hypothetical protein|nr:nuclear transport factor 2 family protein [Prevotellaceae bacterium]
MKKKSIYHYRLIVGCVCLLMAHVAKAQYTTSIDLQSGAPNSQIKAKMEKNGGALLTELNNAQGEARSLSLGNIEIDRSAVSSLTTMWEICPFRCDELEIVERCLNTPSGGYQIRNIPAIMEPRKGERFDEDKYQELVLNFDASGRISDLCFAISKNQYAQIMRTGLEVTDLRRRSMVVEFVEQFRTAYNRKDLDYIRDIFSDDALIITGKVVERKPADGVGGYKLKPDVEYKVQNKEQYLTGLSRVFQNNARINVVFEDVKVNKHGTKDEIYGVKLIQHWNSGSYSDKGYLFLLWDFKNENKPQIHVRTWQPYDETPKEKVFDTGDFLIKE